MASPRSLRAGAIETGLRTHRFGRPLFVYDSVASTNDVARVLAEQNAHEGTAVLAQVQTAGRGRLGRRWISPAGGLWLSVVLRPAVPLTAWPLLGFAAALGAAEAADGVTGLRTGLKWPNDLTAGGRKIGGVLVEAGAGYAVAGIGLNANVAEDDLDPPLAEAATSLAALLERPVDLEGLAQEVLYQFERSYDLLHADGPALLDRWRERAVTLGRAVRIAGAEGFDGVAENVDDYGALMVRTPDGVRRVVAGDVSLRDI